MGKSKKDWKKYANVCFKMLRAVTDDWDTGDHDTQRTITRTYYVSVFDTGNWNNTGLISEYAIGLKSTQYTHDHCLRPQLIGRMIMDNHEKYLSDYETFEKLFFLSCMVVRVTKSENKQLSLQTENKKGEYKILTPTNLLYETVGIELYKKVENNQYLHVGFDIPLNCSEEDMEEYQELFEDVLEYEKKFM